MMGERTKNTIEIPVWMIGVLVTVIMAIFSWGIATAANSSATSNQVKVNSETLKELKADDKYLRDTKADKDVINEIRDQLNRIEKKLDDHMIK